MKRCPECRRDYYDDTLLYCLDDGNALLEGPGSLEPRTAVFHETDGNDTAVTRHQISALSGEIPLGGAVKTEDQTLTLAAGPGSPVVSRGRFVWIAVALTVLLVAAGSYAVYWLGFAGARAANHFENIKVSRATNDGNVESVTISPDGKYLAYVTVVGPTYALWTKHLPTNSRVQIAAPPGSVAIYAIVFSPDSNYVFYGVQQEMSGSYDLYQVAVLGGVGKKVISNIAASVSFSPDGKKIAFTRFDPVTTGITVLTAHADGSDEQIIASPKLPEIIGSYGAAWSPDGKSLAIDRYNSGPEISLETILLADGTISPLTPKKFNNVAVIRWLPDRAGLVFAAQEHASEATKIWYLPMSGAVPRLLTVGLSAYSDTSLMPTMDGSTIVALERESSSNIYVANAPDLSNTRRVSTRTGANDGVWGLSWDKTGRLFSVSQDENKSETWMIEPGGAAPKTVMEEAAIDTVTVSPDGKYLVFISKRSGSWDIWRTDINGGNPKQLTNGVLVSPGLSITPDGRWILFTSIDSAVRRVSIDGGEPTVLVNTASTSIGSPQISPNGSYLACYSYDAQLEPKINIFKMEGDAPMPFKTLDLPKTFGTNFHWAADSQSLIYADTIGRVSNLWHLPLDGGKPKQLTNFTSETIKNFAFSHDGKQLALARGPVTSDAVLISEPR